MIDEGVPPFLNLTVLIIIDGTWGFLQGQLKRFHPDWRHLGPESGGTVGVKTGGCGRSMEAGIDRVPREVERAGMDGLKEVGHSGTFRRGG